MGIFPKIQSPCPYRGDISAIMDGTVCRLCKREVFDLTAMNDAGRVAFMEGCSGEVCVRYNFARPAVAAAALMVAAMVAPTAAAACDATQEVEIMMGGIKDPANVQYVRDTSDRAVPQIPVVYEAKAPAKQDTAGGDKGAAPVNSPAAP